MEKRLLNSILICFLIFQVSCKQGSNTSTSKNSEFSGDSLELALTKMRTYIDEGKLAGISVLTARDGKIIQRESFGYSDIEKALPIEDNTIFRIFSMSKPITAVALMTLFDEGKFELDDKVSEYIPEFAGIKVYNPGDGNPVLESPIEEITIRHLLTHTSGIPYGWDPGAYVDSLYRVNNVGGWDGTIGDKVKILAQQPVKSQPGTKWEYGLSIDVAGYLIEVLSGTPLDKFFEERIFIPLKMNDSGFYTPENKHDRLSSLYRIDRDGELANASAGMGDVFKNPPTLFSGGGGLVSTMDDYFRFCTMLLNKGELDGVRILKQTTTDLILSDQLPEGVFYAEGLGYGLAGAVELESGEYSWAGAASTNFWINPSNGLIVITLTQLMPSDYTYAYDYKKTIDGAIIME